MIVCDLRIEARRRDLRALGSLDSVHPSIRHKRRLTLRSADTGSLLALRARSVVDSWVGDWEGCEMNDGMIAMGGVGGVDALGEVCTSGGVMSVSTGSGCVDDASIPGVGTVRSGCVDNASI